MLARIRKNLNKKDDEGFTLIELLVVMIIIGILVAIAIPIFLNQKNKAHETAVKADVKQLGVNMETALTDGTIAGVTLSGTQAAYKIDYTVGGVAATTITGRLTTNEEAKLYFDPTNQTYCATVHYGDAASEAVADWQMADGVLARGNCTTPAYTAAGSTSG